jgi:hypothetical protein
MTDATRRNKPLNSSQVALDERWQVSYWTTALRCNEGELREAVAAVGLLVANVRRYLAAKLQ